MPKVLITGVNGNIGSALKKALVAKGDVVIDLPDNAKRIQNLDYFDAIPNPDQIDLIYHLAAASFVPKSWEHPHDFLETNLMGTSRVLEFCRQYAIRLVYVSSYAYGIPQYLPIDENHPIAAANPYGLSKIMAEELCQFYGENYNLSYAIIRPFNVYGTLKNKALLIPEIIEQIKAGKEINVKDLRPKRDYIFIDDLIELLVLAQSHTNNEVYNAGSGASYSVKDIIDACQMVFETNLPVHSAEQERKNEIPETLCNISKVKKTFGWEPKYNFIDGIKAIKQRLDLG